MAAGILLKVTPAEVRAEGVKVNKVKDEVTVVVNKIYQVKNALVSCAYKSDSAKSYAQRLEQYRVHFDAMKQLLDEYVKFLENASIRYNNNEDTLVGNAGRLPV